MMPASPRLSCEPGSRSPACQLLLKAMTLSVGSSLYVVGSLPFDFSRSMNVQNSDSTFSPYPGGDFHLFRTAKSFCSGSGRMEVHFKGSFEGVSTPPGTIWSQHYFFEAEH
jgi:hypothetical protein